MTKKLENDRFPPLPLLFSARSGDPGAPVLLVPERNSCHSIADFPVAGVDLWVQLLYVSWAQNDRLAFGDPVWFGPAELDLMRDPIGEILLQMIFGWPAIITSILLSIAGVWLKKPAFLVAAGIVGLPFAAYMTAGYRVPGLLMSFFQFGSAYAVNRQRAGIAWLLVTPMIIFAAMIAYVVLTQ